MTSTPVRRLHQAAKALAIALSIALLAGLAGCGDNKECQGDDCTTSNESCGTAGDEDGNGLADRDDPVCDNDPACLPQCPNGIQNIGEGCDDGNMVDTDACTNTCTRARCGDGIGQTGVEECDDGNTVDTDACTNACDNARCGDGITGPNEQCDDGNQVNTDGCTNTCTTARCGDSITGPGEQCDDGNQVNTDACTNACTTARCGDAITGPNEQCDDGNQSNTDACTNTCQSMRCGDGFAQPGEACDDGNLINTDGCTNVCALPSCGDGFQQAAEQCDDGNQINTDGCLNTCMTASCGDGVTQAGVEQCDDANQVDTDACRNTCIAARCGDTVVQAGVEQCDDGNLINTDTCTNVCTSARCGDGFMQGTEACDDGNNVNGDGCDNTCVLSGCGNGVVGGTEQCDDANLVNGDGCDNNCTTTACGNGIRTGTEVCDDGNILPNDGCSATCTIECGNGVINGAEQCDDGNQILVDGCDNSCKTEANEAEPNEDGMPSTGGSGIAGNDFDVGGMLAVNNATTQGLIRATVGSTARLAKFDPAGDEDVYAVINDTAAPIELRLDVWNRAVGYGVNVPCATSLDTGLNIRNAAGVVLVSNDDRNSTADQCSGLSMILAANTTIYAHVVKYGDASAFTTPGYGFQVKFIPIVCGDNRVVGGIEECDDGNAANNDGCSAACVVEGLTEVEPNEDGVTSVGGSGISGNDFDVGGMLAVTNATTQGVVNVAAGNKNWLAALNPAGDEDVFAVTNNGALTYEVQFDIWDPASGVGLPCPTAMDTGINVRDAAGVVVTSNDTRVSGDNCSRVLFLLAPGQTRYVQVVEYNDNGAIVRYVAAMTRRAIVCGDTTQTAGVEECDDGNLVNNDGCSATCTVEGTGELEPNEDGVTSVGGSAFAGNDFDIGGMLAVNNAATQGVANLAAGDRTWRAGLSPAGDEDVFAVTNNGALPIAVQADTWDLSVGINKPCVTTDTGINVRDAAGVVVASNDTRVSGDNCSRVTFGLLPGQTRYIHVVEYGDNAAITKYAMVVDGTPVICGDNAIGFGEECDGGNAMPGDGCGATCQLEAPTNEGEPNGTSAEADAAALQVAGDALIRGTVGPLATDVDRFKVTVAAASVVRFETFAPLPNDCDTTTTTLRLFDSAGVSIVTSTTDGIASCSAIVMPLAAGTYYVQVEESGLNAVIAKYFLEVDFQTDKGMETEGVGVLGVNDTFATADVNLAASTNVYVFGDHTLNADGDFYAITVPAGKRIRAELIEGDRGTVAPAETCESFGIDSLIELRDQLGVLIVSDDDDGRGFCSLLDGSGTSPLDALARNATAVQQTYFINVRQSGTGTGTDGQFKYRLQVTIR